MDSDIDAALDRAEACWITALARVRPADLQRPSGCPEWTNRELINHLIGGGLRYAKLLAQAPSAEVEATRRVDHLGADLMESFWIHERAFRAVAEDCDLTVEVPHRIGLLPGTQLVRMRILELALHAADLSRGMGLPWPIDDTLAEFMSTQLSDLIVELGSTGGYAPPRTPAAQMSHAQRVLQISGR
ncbi:MAG: maleylpyruvate isomerase family mycothiol-dependent enzyme [Brevibacterium sp.]